MLLFIDISSIHTFFTGSCTTLLVALKSPSPCTIKPNSLAFAAKPAPCTPPKLVVIIGIPGKLNISPSNTLLTTGFLVCLIDQSYLLIR